ncbi:MAG: FlgD immunoglobulin-like domain containing protein [Candidatus Cloacimonadota bacterium]|nr:FlgD immunoglobulin-like domain containing protein [Candidatus Cloacimonadota bacterium]
MKHIAFTLIFTLILFSQLVGNPVIPILISEIYFEEDEWTIELSDYYGFFETLDNLYFATSSDTAQFKSGIFLYENIPIIVNQDSMLTFLSINKNGDFLQVGEEYDGEWFDVCLPVYFGDYPDSWVNAPYEGQSLARVIFEIYNPPWSDIYFYLVKDNIPSLGYNPYQANTVGAFSGYVFDQQQNPISNAQIHYFYCCDDIYTNQNGYFENNYMYGINYNVTIYVDDIAMMDTLITIEPDSTTYCEFYIDIYSVDKEQLQRSKIILSNYPNPFIKSTTISFSATSLLRQLADTPGQAKINIYNIKGQLVKQLSIDNRQSSIEWDGKNESDVLQPPGFYFYSLEIDGKKVKTNKMIMVR